MSEMTVEQAIYCIDTENNCEKCDEKIHKECYKHDYYKKSVDMAIKALEENEKLRIDHRHIYDQLMETEKDAQTEIARLNGIIEQLSNQMSAVEVLEFLMNDTLSVDNYWFHNYTPKEIVDKIQEYEKLHNKDSLNIQSNNEQVLKEAGNNFNMDVTETNVGEFKVGDWARSKSTGDYGEITRIFVDNQFLPREIEFNGDWHKETDCEHAILSDYEKYIEKYCRTYHVSRKVAKTHMIPQLVKEMYEKYENEKE